MTSCSAGAALVCYMVSSVEGEGKIEGYHGVYGGKLQRVYIEDGWQGHMVQSSAAQAGNGDWEVYGVMLRSVLLRGRAALYGAAITGHSVWELVQPSTNPALGKGG